MPRNDKLNIKHIKWKVKITNNYQEQEKYWMASSEDDTFKLHSKIKFNVVQEAKNDWLAFAKENRIRTYVFC